MSYEKELAERAVRLCQKLGAGQAEALVIHQQEKAAESFGRQVRLSGTTESTRMTVRLFRNQRGAVVTARGSSDQAMKELIERSLAVIRHTSQDKFLGVADLKDLGWGSEDLRIYDDRLAQMPLKGVEEIALAAESAVAGKDQRTANLITSSLQVQTQAVALCTSEGFCESYKSTLSTLLLKAIVDKNATELGAQTHQSEDEKLAGGTGITSRFLKGIDLEKAAARTVQKIASNLDARPSPSGSYPVVFAPSSARFLPSLIAQLCSGPAVAFMHSSFLGKVEDSICSPLITIVDDAALAEATRTVPFDHEGVKSRRKVIVDGGVLKQYLLNSYYARALRLNSTGSAVVNSDARFDVKGSNTYVEKGDSSPESIIADIRQGFYLTGFLSNRIPISTNFAQGASGFWIENGKLAYPVRGATISAPFKELFHNIVAVGNDLDLTGASASPTLLVSRMNVSPLSA